MNYSGQVPTVPGHIDPMLHGSPSVLHDVHDVCAPPPASHPQSVVTALSHESDVTPPHVAGGVTQQSSASLLEGAPESLGSSELPPPPPHAKSTTSNTFQGFMEHDRSTPCKGST